MTTKQSKAKHKKKDQKKKRNHQNKMNGTTNLEKTSNEKNEHLNGFLSNGRDSHKRHCQNGSAVNTQNDHSSVANDGNAGASSQQQEGKSQHIKVGACPFSHVFLEKKTEKGTSHSAQAAKPSILQGWDLCSFAWGYGGGSEVHDNDDGNDNGNGCVTFITRSAFSCAA